MATTIGDKKQELSFSYSQTVAAIAGFTFDIVRQDYGIDGTFRRVDYLPTGKPYPRTEILNFQAKASTRATRLKDGIHLSFPIKAKDYNKLVTQNNNNSSPCILVAMVLPRDETEWTEFDEDALKMSGCCYWTLVRSDTVNSSEIAVRIPRANKFTPEALSQLYSDMLDGNL